MLSFRTAASLAWLPLLSACGGSTATAPTADPAPAQAQATAPAAMAIAAPRAPDLSPAVYRDGRLTLRSRALLVTELAALESLFRATAKEAPDRPAMMRRLAEDYAELERATIRDARADDEVARAREAAEKNYRALVAEYPSYAQLDEVLYYLAYEEERGGEGGDARRTYYELVAKHPSSAYVPRAYVAFGEMFFAEAGSDPSKWELAAQSYAKALESPPPEGKAYGYALYRLGLVRANQGDREKAREAWEKAVTYAGTYAGVLGAKAVGEAAAKQLDSAR
jgi:tetratricopeptide (TPR) repeat protein